MIELPDDLRQTFERIAELYRSDRERVPDAIASEELNIKRLQLYLRPPGTRPYGRCPLFQTDDVEVIIMNWAHGGVCLPHDHGASEGWVKVLCGVSTHSIYSVDESTPVLTELQKIGDNVFYAKPGLVHAMANETDAPLVTLHFYFPPIHAMEVFDPEESRAAIVADDCGAWWPDSDAQIVSVRSL